MKAQLFALSAAGLLFAASASHALPGSQDYARRINAKAEAMLRDAGLANPLQAVSIRVDVGLDGRPTRVRITRSSGSRDTDRAIAEGFRRIVAVDPLTGVIDGAVTLNVGRDTLLGAEDR